MFLGSCLLRKLAYKQLGNNVHYLLGYTNKLHSDLLLFIYSTWPRSTTYNRTSLWRRYKDVKVVNLVSVQTAVQTGKKWMSIQTRRTDINICDHK